MLFRGFLGPRPGCRSLNAQLLGCFRCQNLAIFVSARHEIPGQKTKKNIFFFFVFWLQQLEDSGFGEAPDNLVWAKQILINIGIENLVEYVKKSNKLGQNDAWSCGIWVLKWIEADLRARRDEVPMPLSIQMVTKRVNVFIEKLKQKALLPAAAKAAAPAPPAVPEVLPDPVGDKFKTLEEALDAAASCKKCLPTQRGTKGCSQCMGNWFEQIRLQKLPKKALKLIAK